MRMRNHLKLRTALALLTLACPLATWAALGGTAASVQNDQAKMKATLRPAAKHAQYSVHELQTPSGITVKEYVDNNGNVFAITWKGPVMPDLQQLLGTYFSDYITAARNRRGGHHHLIISQPGLVVHAQGHMRAFFGVAYLPARLPAGVSPDALK